MVSEAFEVFPSNDAFYWQQAGGSTNRATSSTDARSWQGGSYEPLRRSPTDPQRDDCNCLPGPAGGDRVARQMITKRTALSSCRAEAQDNAIEHLLERARGEHGKRLAASIMPSLRRREPATANIPEEREPTVSVPKLFRS